LEDDAARVDTRRVALIRYRSPDGKKCVGSGVLIDGYTVLTADHVAEGSGHGVECHAGARAVTAVLRTGTADIDLAILTLGESAGIVGRLGCAQVARDQWARVEDCSAVGFPRWRKAGDLRRSAQVDGHVPTAEGLESTADSGLRAGFLTLVGNRNPGAPDIPSGLLSDSDGRPNPWGGMSGAAVAAGSLVIGVVRSHNLAAGGQSLTVTPLTGINDLPPRLRDRFWAALGVADTGPLTVLPDPPAQALAQDYYQAVRDMDARAWPKALRVLMSIHQVKPDYRDVVRLAKRARCEILISAGGSAEPVLLDPEHVSTIDTIKATGLKREVRAVAFSPDSKWLAMAYGRAAVITDLAGTRRHRLKHGHVRIFAWGWDVAFSPDGTQLATVAGDKTVRIWEVGSGREIQKIWRGKSPDSVAFSPDGRLLATAGFRDGARVWDVEEGTELFTLDPHETVTCVRFSPDGSCIATGGQEESVCLWNARTRRKVLEVIHPRGVGRVAFSSDSTLLATAGRDGVARVWDTSLGNELLTLKHIQHEPELDDACTDVAFSPDGSLVATSGKDSDARVWDAVTGKQLHQVCHRSWSGGTSAGGVKFLGCNSVAFSCDGELLATAGDDGDIQIWRLNKCN